MRGTGPAGLAAIYPIVRSEEALAAADKDDGESVASGELVRPLLEVRRGELREYLDGLGQGLARGLFESGYAAIARADSPSSPADD